MIRLKLLLKLLFGFLSELKLLISLAAKLSLDDVRSEKTRVQNCLLASDILLHTSLRYANAKKRKTAVIVPHVQSIRIKVHSADFE